MDKTQINTSRMSAVDTAKCYAKNKESSIQRIRSVPFNKATLRLKLKDRAEVSRGKVLA